MEFSCAVVIKLDLLFPGNFQPLKRVSGSKVVSIPVCHTGDGVRFPAREVKLVLALATQLDWVEVSCAVVIKLPI